MIFEHENQELGLIKELSSEDKPDPAEERKISLPTPSKLDQISEASEKEESTHVPNRVQADPEAQFKKAQFSLGDNIMISEPDQ